MSISALDIPESYFMAFVECNSAKSNSFYVLKDRILSVFGHENDYDLQHITKKCRSCNGSGYYYRATKCYHCFKGVYEKYDVVLRRYLLNGSVFHVPVGRLEGNRLKIWAGYGESTDDFDYPSSKWRYESFSGIIKNTIMGLVNHQPPGEINANWAYWYLLHRFNHPEFLNETTVWLNTKWDSKEFQLRNYLWLTSNTGLDAIAKYYKCEEQVAQFLEKYKPSKNNV
jgi:hypothetical protein